jgi:hypothetical protein
MPFQMIYGRSNILGRLPGKKRVFLFQVFQPLVVDGGGEIALPGQIQTDSFHVSGQPPGIGVDQDGRQGFFLRRRIGNPMDPQLVPVKDQAFADNSRLWGEGVDQVVIIRPAAKGRE